MIFLQCFLGCLFAFAAFLVFVFTFVLPYAIRKIAKDPDIMKAYRRGAEIVPAPTDDGNNANGDADGDADDERQQWEASRDKVWADGIDLALDRLYRKAWSDAEAREYVRALLIQLLSEQGYRYQIPNPDKPLSADAVSSLVDS